MRPPLAVFSELRIPGSPSAQPVAVSRDGRYVAGHGSKAGLNQAVRWTDTEAVVLGAFENGNGNYANDISDDGSVVVGFSETLIGRSAFRFDGEFVELSPLARGQTYYAEANAVSGDGKIAAGISTDIDGMSVPVQWISGSIQQLPVLAGHGIDIPLAIDADGGVMAGTGQTAVDSSYEAVRWPANGVFSLNLSHSEVTDVSGDGKYIVGTHNPTPMPGVPKRVAFRWSAADGVEFLPKIPGDMVNCVATATTADGAIVAGYCNDYSVQNDQTKYFLWTQAGGLVFLDELLLALGVDTSLYQLGGVADISADGTAIVGTALKAGVQIGWRAIIDSKFP